MRSRSTAFQSVSMEARKRHIPASQQSGYPRFIDRREPQPPGGHHEHDPAAVGVQRHEARRGAGGAPFSSWTFAGMARRRSEVRVAATVAPFRKSPLRLHERARSSKSFNANRAAHRAR